MGNINYNYNDKIKAERKRLIKKFNKALDFYEQRLYPKAYDLLLQVYFDTFFVLNKNDSFRLEVVNLFEKLAKEVDPETFEVIHEDSLKKLNKDSDILRSVYFSGIKFGRSLSELVNDSKVKLSEKLNAHSTLFDDCYTIQFYKNYSSFTPLLRSSDNRNIGGGYFLNLDNYGLVIDPGHNFLRNFYSANRKFNDINGIVVTHFHDDHYADFPSLLALIFQHSKDHKHGKKKYDLFLDSETYDNFNKLFNNGSNFNQIVKMVPSKKLTIQIKPGIRLIPLRTNHSTFIKNSGVGILLNISPIQKQLYITGDTGWSKRIENHYNKQLIENWERILVAHISSFFNDEIISYIRKKPIFYKKHLCVHGLIKCIELIRPKKIILSEIGEELASVIDSLANMISAKYNISCEIGMLEKRNKEFDLRDI